MTSIGKLIHKLALKGRTCGLSIERTSGRLLRELPSSSIHVQRSFVVGQRTNRSGIFATSTRQFSDMPRPIVYIDEPSPPSRAVLLAAEAIGLDIDVRRIYVFTKGQNLSEEYKKMNPEHTVPTLNDDGFILWDSHAIMCYLVDKYAKDDTLYPKDLRKRALINQRLHFETGVLFSRLRLITYALFTGVSNRISDEKLYLIKEAYGHLNNFLEGRKWLAGDTYTLADISCAPTVSTLAVCILPIDGFPNIEAWLKRCEETLPGYATLNIPGRNLARKFFRAKMSSEPKL